MFRGEVIDVDALVAKDIHLVKDIDLSRREALIRTTVGDNLQFSRMISDMLSPEEVTEVPPELYGFVPVEIVVCAETGETQTHMADEVLLAEFDYHPNLLGVRIPELSGEQLITYESYCGVYVSYLDSLVEKASGLEEMAKLWARRLYSRLQGYYEGNQNEARRKAKIDPAVEFLENLSLAASLQEKELKVQVKSLKDRLRNISHELDRRKQAYFREASTGFGSGRKPRPTFGGR